MAQVAGIVTEADEQGNLTKITIDVKENPQAVAALKQAGIIPKKKFDLECEEAQPVEEMMNELYDFVKNHPQWKK